MSLLNDVLRDLDQRLPARGARARARAGGAKAAAPAKSSRPWLPLAAGVAVIYYIAVEVLGSPAATPPVEPVAANPSLNPKWLAQLPAATAAVNAAAANAVAANAVAANAAAVASAAPAAPVPSRAAEELTERGLAALAAGQYLPPGPVNALHLLQTALALAPEHSAAQAGLMQLGERLSAEASAAVAAGDITRAQTILEHLRRERLAVDAHAALIAAIASAPAPPRPSIVDNNSPQPKAAATTAAPATPDWRRMVSLAESGDAGGLEQLAARLPASFAALARGQAAFLQGDLNGARAQLESLKLSGEAEWLRLRWLASFCWAAADMTCAHDHYARASQNPAANGADWLGLAISSEQLGRPAAARAAYSRARAAGGHSFEVQRYIESRLAALGEAR